MNVPKQLSINHLPVSNDNFENLAIIVYNAEALP